MQLLLKNFFLILGALIVGIGLTTSYFHWKMPRITEEKENFKKCTEQYPFLSDELDCGSINEKIEQVEDLDRKIEMYANQEENAGHADAISIFFRDLNTRRWFGVNENVNFYPASLAKLPIAMMFYKTAEVNKKILDVPLEISESDMVLNDGQHYKVRTSLEATKTYPVKELIQKMLTESDNVPVNALMNASDSFRDSVLSDLGIYFPPLEGETTGEWNISAKSYANLYRILFNASYVRPEYANALMEALAQSTFTSALVAGVPDVTKVAHKYGEISHRDETTGETFTILNDCGIVYKKDAPYILCVMTRGKEFSDLERIIKTISETVYQSL